jgi:23S rRNA (uracil1939-C5)-methyltransferase
MLETNLHGKGWRGAMNGKPQPMIEVEVEKLVYGGEGLGRVDGQVLLTPYVLPGERVVVSPQRVNSGLLRGSLVEIAEAAPRRITPRCEYFANCGGCQYQHADYALQLEQKQLILRETLQRVGRIHYDGEIRVLSAEPWHYRNRIQLHFAEGKSGFHKAGSHDLCSIDHCPISSPLLNEVIAKLQTAVRQSQWPQFVRSIELFTNETELQLIIQDSARPVAARFFEWCGSFLPPLAPGALDYHAGRYVYRVSRGSFFQVNRFLINALVDEVLGDASGEHAVDLYAGVGLFSLPLAQRFKRVDAVERNGPAYRDLEWNARQAAAIRPAKASAEAFLSALSDKPDLIVADPPRSGSGRDATIELLRVAAPKLTIVSCDPATLARDLRKLLDRYRIAKLCLVDLFPQTYHFEVVARLEII